MRTFNINADLYNKLYYSLECKQNDDITIKLNILENGVACDLTNATFSFNFVKNDNTIVSVAGNNISVNGNIVTIMCPTDCTRAVGVARAELAIVQNTKQATTFDIAINVLPSIIQGQAASENVATIVDEINNSNTIAINTKQQLDAWIAVHGDIVDLDTRVQNNTNSIGNLSALTTTDKTSLVNAVKENTAQINSNKQLITGLDTSKANKSDLDSTNLTVSANYSDLSANKADKATVNMIQTQVNSLASGSPKGTYATVTALTTAFPSGNSNTYIVDADGCRYYWNGTVWVSGGIYQSRGIGSETVSSDTFVDGLFIKRNYEVSGTCNQNESHFVLVYPVKNGLNVGDTLKIQYDVMNKLAQQARVVTKIGYSTTDTSDIGSFSGISAYLTDTYAYQNATKTITCNYTIPANSYYVKIYITFASMNGLAVDAIIKNIKISNSFGENLLLLPYTNGLLNFTSGNITATDYGTRDRLATQTDVARIDGDIQNQKLYFDNKLLSKWSGKTLNVLGDSQTAGANTTKTYHAYLKEMLGLGTVNNYGINGSTIGYGSDSMCTRCLNMADGDLIMVLGGTNDFNLARPLGTFYTEASGVRTIREDTGYFRPSLNILCKNLKTKYPDKTIILCTPIHRGTYQSQPTEYQVNSAGIYFEDYVQSVRDACEIWSIPCLDLYELSGLQPNLPANASLYFHDGTDGNEIDLLHPNATGHQRMATIIAQFLNNVV